MQLTLTAVKINFMHISVTADGFSYPFEDIYENKSGVYVVATRTDSIAWKILYVGESENVKNRLQNHEQEPCWVLNKRRELRIFVYYCDFMERKNLETMIKIKHNPVCTER